MRPRVFKTAEGLSNWIRAHPAVALNFQPVHITLLHDGWCGFPDCNCSPWFRVEIATPENVAEGARQEREWRKSRAA
jgi:hypothetical protein